MDERGERLLTLEQASQMLGVPNEYLDDCIRKGEIPSVVTDDGLFLRARDVLTDETRSYHVRGCELFASPETVDEAAACFRSALTLNPRYNLAWFELGRLYYTWGRYYEADEPLRKTIELNPCFPAYVNYGLSCNLWGKYREAEEAFKQALKIVPEHAEVLYQLGFAIMMTSFYEPARMREAIEYFRESLDLRPAHALTANFLGESLVLHLGAFDEAGKFAQGIDERLPRSAEHIRRIIQLNEPGRRSARQ